MKTNKDAALKAYKEAKNNYIANMTNENWIRFCDAKRTCMLLGMRI